MSTEQKPSGVAGKLIDEIRVHYKAAGDGETAQAHGNQMAGVIALHEELSREARAILAEIDAEIENRTTSGYTVQRRVFTGQRTRLLESFQRLGLTLESEDE